MPITQSESIEEYITRYLIYRRDLIQKQILQIAQDFAPQIQQWMVDNHVWANQTYDAESKLYAEVEELANGVAINFGGRSNHQKYLEFSMSGRFMIVGPALDFWSIQIYNTVSDALTNASVTTIEALPYGSTYRNLPKST